MLCTAFPQGRRAPYHCGVEKGGLCRGPQHPGQCSFSGFCTSASSILLQQQSPCSRVPAAGPEAAKHLGQRSDRPGVQRGDQDLAPCAPPLQAPIFENMDAARQRLSKDAEDALLNKLIADKVRALTTQIRADRTLTHSPPSP